jgi:hypothetical protein
VVKGAGRGALLVIAVVVAGGCSHGPKRIHFGRALPACSSLVATLTAQGMPAPQLQPGPSSDNPPDGFDCLFTAATGSRPPVLAAVTVQVYRPSYGSAERDPAKRFGEAFVAKESCAGTADDNLALPASSRCFELKSPQHAVMTVTSFAKQSAIRVSVDWTETTPLPEKLRSDALDRANAVGQSIIGML